MKKIIIVFLALILIVLSLLFFGEQNLKGDKKLNSTINSYIANLDEPVRNYEDYKCFASSKVYGTKVKLKKELEVYAWIVNECFYREGEKVISDSGSSIPYKFILKSDGDSYTVLSYEIPGDGSYYARDMKKLFPWSVRQRFNRVHDDNTVNKLIEEIQNQTKKYYGVSKISNTYE